MKKGFMFSVEAILCVLLVLGLLAATAYYVTTKEAPTNTQLTNAQSAQMNAFYFNESAVSPAGENSYCKKIAYYIYNTKTISTKQVCG